MCVGMHKIKLNLQIKQLSTIYILIQKKIIYLKTWSLFVPFSMTPGKLLLRYFLRSISTYTILIENVFSHNLQYCIQYTPNYNSYTIGNVVSLKI